MFYEENRIIVLNFAVARLATMGCLLALSACGTNGQVTQQAPTSDVQAAFSAFYGGSAAEQAARLQSARSLSIDAYFDHLLESSTNATQVVAGIKVSGVHDSLAAMAPLYTTVSRLFPTFGDLWDGLGATPSSAMSEAHFAQTVEAAARSLALSRHGTDSLGLADDAYGPFNPLDPPVGCDTTQPDYQVDFGGDSSGSNYFRIDGAPSSAGFQMLSGTVPLQMGPNAGTRYMQDLSAMLATTAPTASGATNAVQARKFIMGAWEVGESRINTPRGAQMMYSFHSNDGTYTTTVPVGGGVVSGDWSQLGCTHLQTYSTRVAGGGRAQ